MQNKGMFIVGVVVFSLYIIGYLFMIKRQNEIQQAQSKKKKPAEKK